MHGKPTGVLVDEFNLSPNMSLPVPIPSTTIGPDWASDINACLGILDSHNHTPGFGVQIPTAGLNINADLSFNGFGARNLLAVSFLSQPTPFAGVAPNLSTIYSVNGELYWNDGIGNQVKITQSGSVTGATGTITGLPSGTAGAAYISGNQTFVFSSATLTPANLDGASIILRDLVANAFGLTLSPPASMTSSYSITLPQLPGTSGNFLTMDTSGNISATVGVDNTTIKIASNKLSLVATVGLVVSANIPPAVGFNWTVTSPTPAQFTMNPSTPTTVIELNPGIYGTPSTNNGGFPQITIANLVSGYYEVSATFLGGGNSTSEAQAYILTDGTVMTGALATSTVTQFPTVTLVGVFFYSSLQSSITFSVFGCAPTSTVYVNAAAGTINTFTNTLNWIVKKIG